MKYALILLAAALVATGLTAWQYRRMFLASDFALTTQNEAIKQQSLQAKRLLDALTADRDAKQAELNKRAAAQEKTDAQRVTDIRAAERDPAPIRVRVEPSPCRASGGGAAGRPAPAAKAGPGDFRPSYGLLPKETAGRLAAVISEIEIMSAAYASCRATLVKDDEISAPAVGEHRLGGHSSSLPNPLPVARGESLAFPGAHPIK